MSLAKHCPMCGRYPELWQANVNSPKTIYATCRNPLCALYGRAFEVDKWNVRPIEDAQCANIDALLAENAKLKEYRDGHDPKVDFPPDSWWVNMRDRNDQMFTVQYDHSMNRYYKLFIYWYPNDPDLVRWYPIPPLPEPLEVEK